MSVSNPMPDLSFHRRGGLPSQRWDHYPAARFDFATQLYRCSECRGRLRGYTYQDSTGRRYRRFRHYGVPMPAAAPRIILGPAPCAACRIPLLWNGRHWLDETGRRHSCTTSREAA